MWSLQAAVITYKFRLESTSGSVCTEISDREQSHRERVKKQNKKKLTIAIFENDFVVLEEQL